MADNYSRKMVEVISKNLHREQDLGKQPVLDVRNLGIDFGGFMTTTGVCIIIFLICWLVSYLIKKHKAKKLLEEQAIIPNSDKPMSAGKFAYEQRKLEKQRSKNKNNKTKKRKK